MLQSCVVRPLLPFLLFPAVFCLGQQQPDASLKSAAGTSASTAHTSVNDGLFDHDSILSLRLSGNIRDLFNDRGDNPVYHPLMLIYREKDSVVSLQLKAKTRGNFRRRKENCTYPPILLNFPKAAAKGKLFAGADKLKLVCPCGTENYIVREYLVYKLYNLITPQSFRARLVRVTFMDVGRSRELTFLAILLEADEQMAQRNHAVLVHRMNIHGQEIVPESFLTMAMFEYMIGNTDWSTEYFQNTRVMTNDSIGVPYVVPYDFDHSGIVNAPYAKPAEELQLSSVQERRYRGYCLNDLKKLDPVIATFNRLKNDFYRVYET
jgi:hypothetical protein